MSEKRFKLDFGIDKIKQRFFVKIGKKVQIIDQQQNHKIRDLYKACEVLNEQQATIQRFEEYVFSDERILCYNCLFCQEKDIYEVKCKIKGSVDVHGTCQYYEKKGG